MEGALAAVGHRSHGSPETGRTGSPARVAPGGRSEVVRMVSTKREPGMCPDTQQIEELLLGQLAPDQAEAVLQHVLSCPRCEELALAIGRRTGTQLPAAPPEDELP